VIPLRRVIRSSSNVGAVKVAQALGAERMISTMNRFGLTAKTSIGLPGENSAAAKPLSWFKSVNLASAGFGQGISTTPLQMAASYAPFANGGFWVRPKLLLDETAPKKDEARLDLRRVLSLKTVETMRSILTEVTEEEGGTGHEARVPGIRVAGKTGTAQKYVPGVGYMAGTYYSSFIGFLPADRPQLLIAVMVDEPKKPFYASVVAAPLFRRIAERSLQILGKIPRKTVAQSNAETAVTVLPSAPAPTLEEGADGRWIMPNLAGVSLREAMSLVGPHVSNLTIQGSGYLTGQSPETGTVITSQTAVRLSFSPSVARNLNP
jgi:cell division protein FtsI/penicillin-binding protein 2